MKLSLPCLLKKFPALEKFKDQKWLVEESTSAHCNYKELPLKAAHAMIVDLLNFIEKTKFKSYWEAGFSLKIRLEQIESLLLYFSQDTIQEKTLKGDNITQPDPIHLTPKPKKASKVKRQARQK